jgi:outer membrane protein assembly factor BamA
MLKLALTLTLISGADEPAAPVSRAAQVRQMRETKALNLKEPTRPFLEKALYEFKERRVLEQFQEGWYGFHPLLGGMPTGAGFAVGTAYEKGNFGASAQVSLNGYRKYEASLSIPNLPTDRLAGEVRVTHRDFPEERFFGIGRQSDTGDRSTYHLRDTAYEGRLSYRLTDHVTAGALGGWLASDVESAWTTGEALSYLQGGAFLEFDYRDEPENPRAGGHYTVDWTSFQNRGLRQYGFGRYHIEVRQYFPFFNQRRGIAVRARTVLTQTAPTQDVPFHLMPTLGGGDDLRGFDEFRFRDRNLVILNAEYRWEAFSGLDMALFVDAGQVAARARDFDLDNFKTAVGFGFRFNTAKSVFLRADIGFSEEGARLFLKFSRAF